MADLNVTMKVVKIDNKFNKPTAKITRKNLAFANILKSRGQNNCIFALFKPITVLFCNFFFLFEYVRYFFGPTATFIKFWG